MVTRWHLFSLHVCLCLLVVAMLSGCASRKVVTAAGDQSEVPGPTPQVQAPVAEAKVPPPIPPEPSKAVPPASVEPASVEPSPVAAAPVESAPIQIEKPIPPPVREDTRIAEQPIAPAPPSQPFTLEARPLQELTDIFFDFDRFAIRDDARSGLEANAGLLKPQSGKKVLIEGHCDERGTSAYNLVLGERRAQAAAQYLRDLGIPSSQIQITSYGKERPFCTEHSEACWQSNRRAHFAK
jgi:peptidoglycan-associated lipoprotein